MQNNPKTLEQKYPKTRSGETCIGPCYEPGTVIVHPHTLNPMTNRLHPFCPILPTPHVIDGVEVIDSIGACYVPTQKKDISYKDIQMNIILPQIDFSYTHFLKIYYNIDSFDNALSWITDTRNISIYTKLRIMECSFFAFGNEIDIIDSRLIQFYIYVIKNIWIRDIYPKIQKYIYIDENDKIYIKESIDTDKSHKVEKINFFVEKFVNEDVVYKILNRYIQKYKDRWNNIRSHNDLLKAEITEYIINKMKNSSRN